MNNLDEEVHRTIYMAAKSAAFSNTEDSIYDKVEKQLIWENSRRINFPQAIDVLHIVEAEFFDE